MENVVIIIWQSVTPMRIQKSYYIYISNLTSDFESEH